MFVSTVLRRGHRMTALFLSALLLLLLAPPAGADGFQIDNLEPITFTEGGDPVRVAPNATISGSGGFADGFLRFAVAGARDSETLGFLTSEAPDTTAGKVSVVGSAIYLGLGDGAFKQIATISSTQNGAAGSPLRIDFSAALENSDFSGGTQPNGDPVGWTVNRERLVLGALASRTQQRPVSISGSGPYTITGAGYSFTTDWNYSPASHAAWGLEGDERTLATPGTYSGGVVSHAGRDQTLRLQMRGGWCTSPNGNFAHPTYGTTYCSSFGPDAWSTTFEAKEGDDLAFDWAAANGDDDYEVYGFLVNATTNEHHLLMYGRGFQQNWTTAAGQIPADGTYRFRFVSGSYDATGGFLLGASLYIANARVLSSDATDDVATQIARLVTYHDSSDNPASERSITVDADTPSGGTLPAVEVPTEVTLVDDPPVLAAPADVVVTNDGPTQAHGPVVGQLDASDPEDDPMTFWLPDGEPWSGTQGGIAVDQRQVGTTGTLYLDSATGRYVWVVDAALANGRTEPLTETFAVRVDAEGQIEGAGILSDTGTLTARIDIAATAPTAPTDVALVAGDQQVTISWQRPWWTGGETDITYTVERLVGGNWQPVATGLTGLTTTLTDLTNGEVATLRVRAVNVHGPSAPSTQDAATPRTVPGAVTDLTVDERDQRLVIRWMAPADDGGAAVTGYEVTTSRGTCTVGPVVVDGPGTWVGCTITPVTNGTSVTVAVAARNVAGVGSGTSVTGVPFGAPLAPVVTTTRGDGQLQVSWNAAPGNGRAVSGYEVLVDGVVKATTNAAGRSAVVDGLTNGQRYVVGVRAVNLAGAGGTGTVFGTPATVPAAPVVQAVTSGNRILSVAFTAPVFDGGAALIGYQYSVDGGRTWTSMPMVGDTAPIVLRGLTNGVAYDVALRAVNPMGAGPASAARSATPRMVPVWVPSPDGTPGGSDDPAAVDSGGQDTRPAPGTVRVLVDGEEVVATVRPVGTRLVVEGPGFGIELRGTEVDGDPMMVDTEGRLVVREGGMVVVSGRGFAPGSMVDVWLFSDPYLLGEVLVGADGTFASSLPLPEGISVGDHTVQLNGVGGDGELRSASTRLVVMGTAPVAPAPEAAEPQLPIDTPDPSVTPTRVVAARPATLAQTGVDAGSLAGLGLLGLLIGGTLLRVGASRPVAGGGTAATRPVARRRR